MGRRPEMALVRFIPFIFLILFLSLQAHPVYAEICKKPSPQASFRSEIKSTQYIRSESSEGLTEWQAGHNIMAKTVLGVGGGNIGTKLWARYDMVSVEDNLYCVTPVAVEAVFYANPQIHIASNFARGSCEYSEVLAHEQKHITVLRKFHREYREKYNGHFRDILRELPAPTPVALEEVEAEKKKATAFVMEQLNQFTQGMMEELNERQRAIDTRDEYDRVISKCNNWGEKLSLKKR